MESERRRGKARRQEVRGGQRRRGRQGEVGKKEHAELMEGGGKEKSDLHLVGATKDRLLILVVLARCG
eukprot:745002-Hanusia_phi.AAC.1